MRSILFILFCLVAKISFSQSLYTNEQFDRLADAGKVYGYIKYFHPYLQYKNINWDSVFAANVEGILQAENKEEYAAVMQRLLSPLNDNLTTVVKMPKQSKDYDLQLTSFFIRDSLLYIKANDVNGSSWDTLMEAYGNISKVKGVIFDMRMPANSQFTFFASSGTVVNWTLLYSAHLFLKGEILVPSMRTLTYSGFMGSFFRQSGAQLIKGSSQKDLPLVFIINSEDQIPLAAIGLQQAGLASIILEDQNELVLGETKSFYIQDSLIIKIRTGEAINGDGSLSVVQPDGIYSPTDSFNVAIQLAEKMISKGVKNQSNSSHPAPVARVQSEKFQELNNYPSLGYRVLAAAIIFAKIDNLYTNEDLTDKIWEDSYRSTISKFVVARDSLDYLRAVAELYSNINDSHGFITYGSFSYKLNPVIQGRGSFVPPVICDVVEDKVVVSGIYNDSISRKVGIKKGDVILSIDGKDPMDLIEEARKYQSASSKASQTFIISKFILFGNKGQILKLKVMGSDQKIREVNLPTLKEYDGDYFSDDYTLSFKSVHTKPEFRLITEDIGYADLTSPLKSEDMDAMFDLFKNTKAIIFDDRGHPHSSSSHKNPNAFVKNADHMFIKITVNVALSPKIEVIGSALKNYKETYSWEQDNNKAWNINFNSEDAYQGKIVMLINESAQSSAENAASGSRHWGYATLLGSPTAGAEASMTNFVIPGNITLWLNSHAVTNPGGIQPDIYVRPTIKGIQDGKDEVLERAINFLQTEK